MSAADRLFVLRTLLAVALAIYVAYALELEQPYSAGTTVLIVASASRGAVLSKSLWRVAGSAIGVGAAIVLMAWFAQAPPVFLIGLALWLGLCTYVSSILRHFRSYGAVLAGYTVTLVGLAAIADPNRVFDLAMARLAVVVIGVGITALVFLLTDRGPPPGELESQVARLIAAAAALVAHALEGRDRVALLAERAQAGAALAALDQVVEYASVEDAALARFADDVRLAAAALFAVLTGGLRAASVLRRTDTEDAASLEIARHALAGALNALAVLDGAGADLASLDRAMEASDTRLAALAEAGPSLPTLAAITEGRTVLGQLAGSLRCLGALRGDVTAVPAPRLPAYVNHTTALRNGTRAAVSVLLGGVFWIVTGWSSGSLILVMLGPITGLLAQADSASAASVEFFKGVVLAVVAGLLFTYGVLPRIAGFPLLMLTLLPVLAIGLIGTRQPRFALLSTAFLIFFTTLIAPNNPMQFDIAGSLNTSLAFLVGAFAAILAFRVLVPANPVAEALVLERSIRASVLHLARGGRIPGAIAWEHLQHQKLARLSRRLAADPQYRARVMTQALGAVLIGRHLAALFAMARDAHAPRAVRVALAQVLDGGRDIGAASDTAGRAALALAAEAPPVAASLHELGELLRDHGRYLAGMERP